MKTRSHRITNAIGAALEFLLHRRQAPGCWRDFRLAPGSSDTWVTAYVGTTLAQLPGRMALVQAIKAFSWLADRHNPQAGWGYNTLTPNDADSTAWALQLAQATGCLHWQQAQQADRFLHRHLQAEGGIATYADATEIRQFINYPPEASLRGWCSPHCCVTAAAAALPAFTLPAQKFLRHRQRPDGHWQSYWWCEDEYATALAAEALHRGSDPRDPERVRRAWTWACQRRQADGSATSMVCPTGSVFATAWLLRLLLLRGDAEICAPTVAWLLRKQCADGSWPSSAGLRVAPPDLVDPQQFHDWDMEGRIEGSISLDQQGIFTTATVLQAFCKYANAFGELEIV